MKSKIHEFQENRFLQTSKKSIIYLGIAVVAFTNVASALSSQQSFNNEYFSLTQTVQSDGSSDAATIGNDSIEKKTGKECGDSCCINPETIVSTPYTKTMEEIIAENNQIIESTISNDTAEKATEEIIVEDNQIIDVTIVAEVGPLYSKKTTEEIIMEDSQIIESPVFNAAQPIISAKIK